MHHSHLFSAACLTLASSTAAFATDVAMCTDQGRVVIELADAQSPKHVQNFLAYVDRAHYSGTVFHRVHREPGLAIVQGGGFDRQLRGRRPLPPVENESRNGLSNVRGSVAAARTADPHSATSQFYVNLEDNTALDAGAEFGYTVFGRVKEGIQVLDDVSRLPTGASGPFQSDVPTPLVAMTSVARLDGAALDALPPENRESAIKVEITNAASAGDYRKALQWVEHYRASCGAFDAEISILEADAALKASNRERARYVLEDYLALAGEDDPRYQEAVALYRAAVPESQASAELVSECTAPSPPPIPDGSTATMEVMVAGQTAVKEFVAAGETYLACLAKIIDDQERTPEQRNAAI